MKLFHGMNWERYIEHRKSSIRSKGEHVFRIIKRQFGYKKVVYRGLKKNENRLQTVDKKLFSPEGGRIALSANERIAEFLNFAIQAKFAYVNKLKTKIVCMPCLPVPICIRWRLPVENFPQHKSRGKSALLQKRKQPTSEKSIFTSKDKPCILKKRLNGVFD